MSPHGNLSWIPKKGDLRLQRVVEDELTKIIESPLFNKTTRMKRFLEYVVMEALAGRGDAIKGYSIGIDVFDLKTDFNPQINTIVRVQAGQLRRRLKAYYSEGSSSSPLCITLPKGQYQPVFVIQDLTDTHTTNLETRLQVLNDRPTLCIESFQDYSEEEIYERFCKCITAETIAHLGKVERYRIISDFDMDGKIIASEANLDETNLVLSGYIRRSERRVRVSFNVFSKPEGVHLISESIDCDITPETLFDLPMDLAMKITKFIVNA